MKKLILVLILLSFMLSVLLITSLSFAQIVKIVRVVYRLDGVSIIYPVKEGHTTADFDRTMERDLNLKGLPSDDIDSSLLPKDRENRNYWTGKKGEGIKIDLDKKNADVKKEQDKIKELELKLGITKEELKELLK